MFITTACFLSVLIKLRWPKNKSMLFSKQKAISEFPCAGPFASVSKRVQMRNLMKMTLICMKMKLQAELFTNEWFRS